MTGFQPFVAVYSYNFIVCVKFIKFIRNYCFAMINFVEGFAVFLLRSEMLNVMLSSSLRSSMITHFVRNSFRSLIEKFVIIASQ